MGEAERHSNSQVKNIKNSLFVSCNLQEFLEFSS